jgi:hypothetical protein
MVSRADGNESAGLEITGFMIGRCVNAEIFQLHQIH